MRRCRAEIAAVRPYGRAVMLEMQAPRIASAAVPGQFVHILCGDDSGRVLRRPFSIFAVRGSRLAVLLKEVGSGSHWLAERREGEALDILGPLGRGFTYRPEGRPALVAGGTGIAPLHFLALRLAEAGAAPRLFWGMEGGSDFGPLPEEIAGELETRSCCMDGEGREAGTALDIFFSATRDRNLQVFACGPAPMLRRLAESCRDLGETLEVSLEERMACGVGACQGCAVPVRSPSGGYYMACKDGPVFEAGQVDWGRIT
jgi:dihydroorotate dehydrogenase electron transfer subunit